MSDCICNQNNHFTWKYRHVGCSLVELLILSVKAEPINRIFLVSFVSKVAQVQNCIGSILKFRSDRTNDELCQDLNTDIHFERVFIRLTLLKLCLWFGCLFPWIWLFWWCRSIHAPQLRMCNQNVLLLYTFLTTVTPFHFLQIKKKKLSVTSALSFHDNQLNLLIMSTS